MAANSRPPHLAGSAEGAAAGASALRFPAPASVSAPASASASPSTASRHPSRAGLRTAAQTSQRGRRDPHGKMAAAGPGRRAQRLRGSAAGRGGGRALEGPGEERWRGVREGRRWGAPAGPDPRWGYGAQGLSRCQNRGEFLRRPRPVDLCTSNRPAPRRPCRLLPPRCLGGVPGCLCSKGGTFQAKTPALRSGHQLEQWVVTRSVALCLCEETS